MATLEQPYVIRGPLTHEIADISSPVRQFLGSRFAAGLRDVQRRYRENAPALIVPPADKTEANPGTVGTAADWLLRFLLYPQPSIHLALQGAAICGRVGAHSLAEAASTAAPMLRAAAGIGHSLGLDRVQHLADMTAHTFTGPASANDAEPEYLARCCCALARLTEVFRGGPAVAVMGPLSQLRGRPVTADALLALCPPAGLSQLARFREVFETSLIPSLAGQRGLWALGPTFAGSALMNADADVIAAGLLLDLKTTAAKSSLSVKDMFQLIGYALLDFGDEFSLDSAGIFSARCAYLATWPLGSLLDELARHKVSLAATRAAFRDLLIRHTAPGRQPHAAPPQACEQPLHLTADLIAEARKPFSHPGDNTIPSQIFCEVQTGHDGPHLAQIQAFGDDEAWAESAAEGPAAVRYFPGETLCESRGRNASGSEEDGLCALPAGHHGQHTFSLHHIRSAERDPSPEHAARLAQMTRDTP